MRRGFTLIELLAVIVILAIIALIATPIVLKIINGTKISGSDRSVDNYMDVVKLTISKYLLLNDGKIPMGVYTIENNGKTLKSSNITLNLEYNGKALNSGIIIVDASNNIALRNGKVDGINKTYSYESSTSNKSTKSNGDGIYLTDNNRYIYRGPNPNNYIWLDENGDNTKTDSELYRIISYESDGTIKVIREERINNPNPHQDETSSTFSWDTRDTTVGTRRNTNNSYCNYTSDASTYYGCNAWGNQNNTYMQGSLLSTSFYYKYYADNTTTSLSQNMTGGTVTVNSTLNTYLNNNWLTTNPNLNNYIEEHSFNVGGPMYYDGYTGKNQDLEKEKYQEILSTWKGKVGLMNITEYVEASTESTCTSVYSSYNNNNYYYKDINSDGVKEQTNITNTWPCRQENYLYKPEYS